MRLKGCPGGQPFLWLNGLKAQRQKGQRILYLLCPIQDKPAYRIFTGEGKKTDYGDMVKEVLKADVIFFGELHDNLSMIRRL